MWKEFGSRAAAVKYAESRGWVDKYDITFRGPGWYWCEEVEDHVGNCIVERTVVIIPAAQRGEDLSRQAYELDMDLQEARRKAGEAR